MEQDKFLSSDSNSEWVQTKQALDDFIQTHGIPGIMPTSTEVRQAGNKGLDQAINKLGGYALVAAQFGLTMKYTRKPGNYWNDFSHAETELLAFIKDHGTPGFMPIKAELLKAGRGDLANAIIKGHGGIEAVAERLGLQLPAYKRKQRGYWEKFANVKDELLTFIEDYGTPGIMPTQRALVQAGQESLAYAIDLHGGFPAIAEQLELRLSYTKKPDAYWDDFSHIEQELLDYIQEHGASGIMPSRGELIKADLSELAGAFDRHGGSSAVAERLGLQMKIRPMGYWDNFANVEAALYAYIEEHGILGVMPTISALQRAGLNSLTIAIIKKYGGVAAVADRLGLARSYTAKSSGYWDDVSHIERALHQFNEERGMSRIMPTSGELQEAGRSDLASAITNHGGFPAIARQFGFTYMYKAKPDRYWEDFENVEQEILDFNQIQGISGRMPTTIELRDAGKHSLAVAINAHGG
jgi:hypothetical protein